MRILKIKGPRGIDTKTKNNCNYYKMRRIVRNTDLFFIRNVKDGFLDQSHELKRVI